MYQFALSSEGCVLLVGAKGPPGEFMAALEDLKEQLPFSMRPRLER